MQAAKIAKPCPLSLEVTQVALKSARSFPSVLQCRTAQASACTRVPFMFVHCVLPGAYIYTYTFHSKISDDTTKQWAVLCSPTTTIEQLRIIFATHGLPHKVITDNGPITSHLFRTSGINKTVGHQPKFVHLHPVADHYLDIMSDH